MTDTRLLRQPVEAALLVSQEFVESGLNHNRGISITSKIYCRLDIYSVAGTYKALARLLLPLLTGMIAQVNPSLAHRR